MFVKLMMLPIPESPVFLLNQNKHKEAKLSYIWFNGETEENVEKFSELKSNQKWDSLHSQSMSLISMLREDARPILMCIMMMVFQQLSGINAVMFYSVSIFSSSGSWSPHISTIILGVVNIFATILSNSLVDKLGR